MNSLQEDSLNKAGLAKAALRHLAERRLVPTPENYEAAWRAVGGETQARDDAPRLFAESLLHRLVELRLIDNDQLAELDAELRHRRWNEAQTLLSRWLAARPGVSWLDLLQSTVVALTTPHRGWTLARKRDSALRVIEGARRREEVAVTRLTSLVESWTREPLDETPEPVPVLGAPANSMPAAFGAAISSPDGSPITGLVAGANSAVVKPAAVEGAVVYTNTEADLRHQRNERLVSEMSQLLATLCESLAGMADDTSWIRGHAQALRDTLSRPDDYRALAEVRELISQTGEAQRKISERRRESMAEVRQMIERWIRSVGDLSESTDDFGSRIAGYAQRIEASPDDKSLAEAVRQMLADTQSMRQSMDEARDEMNASRSRAMSLESEVSRLEDELATATTQMITDHLTHTMNRRGLEQAFEGALQRAREWRSPLSLAVLDVDDFKRVNDTLGHKGGDDALRQLVSVFKLKLRPSDAVARYGGEEFVLLLPDLDAEQACAHLVRLQREVTSHVFMTDEKRMFITFSAGLTTVRAEDTLLSAVERADQAMYEAKRAGKNCVRIL